MFTGIIEEIGTIQKIEKGAVSGRLTVGAERILSGTKIGDSIAVNGVCLTVTTQTAHHFTADVMAETFRRSNLGRLTSGSPVNLERAMAADGRFGGHIVSGHIDGTGIIKEYRKEENAIWVTIACDKKLLRYIIEKGSIAIDGISLTVAYVDDQCFKVSVIPHTAKETTLILSHPGAIVNLENDVIGKYVDKLLHMETEASKESGVDMDFLAEHGYI